MVQVNKKKYLVLDNGSGGRVALEYQKEFSSAIPYRQIHTNDQLDMSKTGDNVLKKDELQNYHTERCEDKEEAMRLVDEGIRENVSGTSDVLSS